jgi:hypothetical protein
MVFADYAVITYDLKVPASQEVQGYGDVIFYITSWKPFAVRLVVVVIGYATF